MTGKHREPERPRTQHKFADLPPRPDPQTGEPLPHAPNFQGTDIPVEDNPLRETRLFRKPAPPPGMGPVLAWHRDSAKGQIVNYLVALGVFVGGIAVISLLQGEGLDMLTAWPLYPLFLIFAYLMSKPLDVRTDSVGADWLQSHYRKRWYQRRRKVVVLKLYELTRVQGVSGPGYPQLALEDVDGATMYRFMWELQPDRRTWDLVYNGILHSVANGAETDSTSESVLKLAETPALRLRDAATDQ